MDGPCLLVNLKKLRANIRTLADLCHNSNISIAAVTKGVCSEPSIVKIASEGADFIADSRLTHMGSIQVGLPRMCIRITPPSESELLVHNCEISLQSEEIAIEYIAASAENQKKRHKIVLMIDLGDLREGIYYDDEKSITSFIEKTLANPWLELYGVGTNLSCINGVLPDYNNLSILAEIANNIRRRFGIELPIVSGGATSTIPLLLNGKLPKEINNLRIGEAFLLGYDSSNGLQYNWLYQNAFELRTPLLEMKTKPSNPIGKMGFNAFGEKVETLNAGSMVRGICEIGRQDIDINSLRPVDENIWVIGASSDHCVLCMDKAACYQIGDSISFRVGYGSLLRLFTSKTIPYIFNEENI